MATASHARTFDAGPVPTPSGRSAEVAPRSPGWLPPLRPQSFGREPLSTCPADVEHSRGDGGTGSRRAAELLVDLVQMRHEDVELVGSEVSRFRGKDSEKVRNAFRTRLAELLGSVPLQHLDRARQTLLLLHGGNTNLEFVLRGEIINPLREGIERTTNQDPTRVFEERIAYLAYKGVHNLAVLAQCHATTADLAQRKCIRLKVHDVVMGCILRWIERESLLRLRKHAVLLHGLAQAEPSVLAAVERKLVKRALQPFPPLQLAGFAQVLLDLQDDGLMMLDGPGVPVLDQASAKLLPPLQVAVLSALRAGMQDWPMDRAPAEFHGPVLRLVNESHDLREIMIVLTTERAYNGLCAVRDMVLRRVEPTKVQQGLLDWGRFVLKTGEGGFLDFDYIMKTLIMGGPEVVGSMAFCAASCTPNAPELPPEYLGRVPALYERLRGVWKTVMEVMVLLGDDREVAAALSLLDERGL